MRAACDHQLRAFAVLYRPRSRSRGYGVFAVFCGVWLAVLASLLAMLLQRCSCPMSSSEGADGDASDCSIDEGSEASALPGQARSGCFSGEVWAIGCGCSLCSYARLLFRHWMLPGRFPRSLCVRFHACLRRRFLARLLPRPLLRTDVGRRVRAHVSAHA